MPRVLRPAVLRSVELPESASAAGDGGKGAGALPATENAFTEIPAIVENRFSVFRTFSYISLLAIVISAILLAMCYRYVSVQSISKQSEISNLLIAQAALGAVNEDIASFLAKARIGDQAAFPTDVADQLRDVISDTRVRKLRVYNGSGDIIFSTKAGDIGRHANDNPRVVSALAGQVVSQLNYRDVFNRFGAGRDDDNLIDTFLPLQQHHAGPILGVFEIYTDITPMVRDNEQAQLLIVGTAALIMVLLYVSLLTIVRRIEKIIDSQRDALSERSNLLAALSARMLHSQESEKQRIAAELHERVAQTLSAVKLNVEAALAAAQRGAENPTAILESMVPALKAATQEVRSVALGLRPASLDDLGLIPTLRWLCRQFSDKHPHVDVAFRLEAKDEQIPLSLRAIIYRVVEDAFAALAGDDKVGRIALSLTSDDGRITLVIRDDGLRGAVKDDDHPYAAARQRTLLAGGKFSCQQDSWGGLLLTAIWLR